jgi:hypothetical protein
MSDIHLIFGNDGVITVYLILKTADFLKMLDCHVLKLYL